LAPQNRAEPGTGRCEKIKTFLVQNVLKPVN
jgi:hypothetical protein